MAQVLKLLLVLLSVWMMSCESPDDLEAVSGIQGTINIEGALPDSIQAVALIVLDTEALNDQDNIADYLINYSDPLNASGEYYIQLKPDHYIGIVVGLLIDPGLFVVNIDEFLKAPELPLVQLSETTDGGIFVREGIMEAKDWSVSF